MAGSGSRRRASSDDDGALPGLARAGLVRSVRTPEFAGVTFHEVLCKSALNRVPARLALPFAGRSTRYRGCTHGCVTASPGSTHDYLDFDAGADFDTQIVVKTNIADVLRRELAAPSWNREHVAMGTNTDPYQRAEGRYRLMPGIIGALADSGTPFSILTKGTLLRRDLPLLAGPRGGSPVGLAVSLALLDPDLQAPSNRAPRPRGPGWTWSARSPTPACRARVGRAGPARPDRLHEATSTRLIGPMAGGGRDRGHGLPAAPAAAATRGWFLNWLAQEHPALVRGTGSSTAAAPT